jgi:PEP-CTERM putative exosortase interaction domain
MKKISAILTIIALTIAGANAQTIVFSENFGNLTDGTDISTSNTSLTYVRIGNGGGSIVAENPSSFGPGASAFITGPTNASLNGIGVQSTLDFHGASIITFSVDLRFTDLSGNVVIGLGSGGVFTNHNGFSTNDGLFWLQANGTNLQRRTSSNWVDISGVTLAVDTNYTLLVEVDVTAGQMDIWLNGSQVADGVGVTTASITDPTGFRIYSVNGSNVEIDNIVLTAVPEPASAVMLAGGVGMILLNFRRKRIS